MSNPYAALPDHAFWRRSVANRPAEAVDPIVQAPFTLGRTEQIATAGSCFAQHIAKTLVREGFTYLVTEGEPATPWSALENYGTFPARFGNIYTTRQFVQLFERAYGLFKPMDMAFRRDDGCMVDPFRPRIQTDGFPTLEALEADRTAHFAAVRAMFERADVMIFTLGLTEGWLSTVDGAAFPLAPGIEGVGRTPGDYGFHNLSVPEMTDDLTRLITYARTVNPALRFILTVSPVPLIATYEPQHVLVSTTYSKSALRVVAEVVSRALPDVAYFPSYEIITGAHARSGYYAEDLREVTEAGVAQVMGLFKRHYLDAFATGSADRPPQSLSHLTPGMNAPLAIKRAEFDAAASLRQLDGIVCDEEAIEERV